MSTRSGGSFGRGCARANESVSKNAKMRPEVGFVNVHAAHFPGSPLSLRFSRIIRAGRLRASMSTRSGGSFERGRSWENEPV